MYDSRDTQRFSRLEFTQKGDLHFSLSGFLHFSLSGFATFWEGANVIARRDHTATHWQMHSVDIVMEGVEFWATIVLCRYALLVSWWIIQRVTCDDVVFGLMCLLVSPFSSWLLTSWAWRMFLQGLQSFSPYWLRLVLALYWRHHLSTCIYFFFETKSTCIYLAQIFTQVTLCTFTGGGFLFANILVCF